MSRKQSTPREPEPILVGPKKAAELLDLPVSTFHSLLSSGLIGPSGFKLGKHRLFSLQELREWVNRYQCQARQKYLQAKGLEGRK